jgi:hypothetical protein
MEYQTALPSAMRSSPRTRLPGMRWTMMDVAMKLTDFQRGWAV